MQKDTQHQSLRKCKLKPQYYQHQNLTASSAAEDAEQPEPVRAAGTHAKRYCNFRRGFGSFL